MTRTDDDLTAQLQAHEPPPLAAGFAERVLAVRRRQRRRRLGFGVAGGLAAAAAAVFAVMAMSREPIAFAIAAQSTRTSHGIGDRGVAVAEPGSVVDGAIEADGSVMLRQRAGNVFYRVERGGAFAVVTAAGRIDVTGTCFTVDLTRGFTVQVHEGTVRVRDATGDHWLAAGEALRPDPPPAVARRQAPGSTAIAGGPRTPAGDDAEFYGQSRATLERHADECRLSIDHGTLAWDGTGEDSIDRLGLSSDERDKLEAALATVNERAIAEWRKVYVEITGERETAELLSPYALLDDLLAKLPVEQTAAALAQISAERAGRVPVSVGATPSERVYRSLAGLGDDLERELAATVGASRSHALRQVYGGWPAKRSDVPRRCAPRH